MRVSESDKDFIIHEDLEPEIEIGDDLRAGFRKMTVRQLQELVRSIRDLRKRIQKS